jgi:tetratricopeptide (TPR) repeat protein
MKCRHHGKKLEYVCLSSTCESKTSQMCEGCLSSTHNHAEHSTMRLDIVFGLLENKERAGGTLDTRIKMRQMVLQLIADMRVLFNESCLKLEESIDEYIKNMETYNSLDYGRTLYEAQKAVRLKQLDNLPAKPLRDLLVKRPGSTGLLSTNEADLQRFFTNFCPRLVDALSSFMNNTIRLVRSPLFQMFDYNDNGKESSSLAKIELLIQEYMKKDEDFSQKNAESMRMTKHAGKAEKEGRVDEAIDLYKVAIDMSPFNAAARLNLGLILKARGDI